MNKSDRIIRKMNELFNEYSEHVAVQSNAKSMVCYDKDIVDEQAEDDQITMLYSSKFDGIYEINLSSGNYLIHVTFKLLFSSIYHEEDNVVQTKINSIFDTSGEDLITRGYDINKDEEMSEIDFKRFIKDESHHIEQLIQQFISNSEPHNAKVVYT